MTEITEILSKLRRPRLLIRAARFGQIEYDRNRDLKRVLKKSRITNKTDAIGQLIETESHMESTRLAGEAGYSVSRHVEILIALMAEAKLLPKNNPNAV